MNDMNNNDLTNKVCGPCNNLTPRLNAKKISELLGQISGWEVKDNSLLLKSWKFKNFAETLQFVNAVGAIAESEGHHPDINFGYGYAEITLTTHAIIILSEN